MRILVAPDSFKGTFFATEVADAIGRGIERAGAHADRAPIADGGEGTMGVLVSARGGGLIEADAHDPLGRALRGSLGLLEGGSTAIVETAAASGLDLVASHERDAEAASTRGTGELIAAAVAAGARTIILAAGGSATTDGGRGALGAIEAAGGIRGAELIVLCDVTTPFEMAATVYGPQKGADAEAVRRLTRRLDEFAQVLPRDPRGLPMTGAGGGLSGALWAAYGARLTAGATFVLDALGFDDRLAAADIVVSGEGSLDTQTFAGKAVGEVASRARRACKPLHVVVGTCSLTAEELGDLGVASATETTDTPEMFRAGRALVTSITAT